MTNNRNRNIIICILITLVMLFSAGCGGNGASTGNGANAPIDHLSLGERFLLELEYEQALFHFLALIEIEPMNPHGYTGAAQAHVGLGQLNEAIAILQLGLEVLPDNVNILDMLEELWYYKPNRWILVWESFTDEQRDIIQRLEMATAQTDANTVSSIISSTTFGEIFENRYAMHGNGFSALFFQEYNGLTRQFQKWNEGFFAAFHNPNDLVLSVNYSPRLSPSDNYFVHTATFFHIIRINEVVVEGLISVMVCLETGQRSYMD